jgi:hypothetical protein
MYMNQQALSAELHHAPMEHRWGNRVALSIPVSMTASRAIETFGRIVNASVSGALIETPLECAPGAHIEVNFRSFSLDACVVRTERGRLGVEWRDMGASPLVEFLHEAQRDADLWHRDDAFC